MALGDIIMRHGLQQDVCVFLVHKHFDLRDGEVVLIGQRSDPDMPLKTYVDKWQDDKHTPYCWAYIKDEWQPIQYTTKDFPGIAECKERLMAKLDQFLPDITAVLKAAPMGHLLGVGLRTDKPLRTAANPKPALLEITNDEKRQQLFKVVPPETFDVMGNGDNTIITTWMFDPRADARCEYCQGCQYVRPGVHTSVYRHWPDDNAF